MPTHNQYALSWKELPVNNDDLPLVIVFVLCVFMFAMAFALVL